jgi:hypothetical protein
MRNNQIVNMALNTDGFGAEVIQSMGIPTNLGAGTNEDRAIALALAETPSSSRLSGSVRTRTCSRGTFRCGFTPYAYLARVGARLAASIGVLSGTGLVPPTFR